MSDRPPHPAATLDDDDPRLALALFRYRVVADLVTLVLTPGELTALVRDAAQKRFRLPDGTEASFSARTIWTWLSRYRKGGLDALLPKLRKDKGTLRAISPDVLERAALFRREDRSRSATTIVDMLERDGRLGQGAASRQTIDRALRRMDLARIRPGRALDKCRRRIEVDGPNSLWVGDYHDLAGVPLTGGATLRCHVSAFIDHFSRYIVHAAYYPSQAIYTLEDTFKKAVLKAGRPEKVYVDNAKIYRSNAFSFACDKIGTKLVHSKPYESEGRGVIERFWGTVTTFERELVRRGARDLAEVNRLFWAWLEESYHARRHDEIDAVPSERRVGFEPLIPIDVISELFLVAVRRTVHRRLSTVEVEGLSFHVEPSLRGKLVQVRYDPHDLSSVVICFDGRRIQRAGRALPNVAPETPPAPEAASSGFDYLGKILVDHERRRVKDARAIAFSRLAPAKRFDLAALERHLALAMGRPLRSEDKVAARAVFERYHPLREEVVTLALSRAHAARGTGLHVSVYLEFVRSFHMEKGG